MGSLGCELGEVNLSVYRLLEEVVEAVLGACVSVKRAFPRSFPRADASSAKARKHSHSCDPGSCFS